MTPPDLSTIRTASDVRDYADQLEVYERENEVYKELIVQYADKVNTRLKQLQTVLRDDYDITEAQFWILWDKAWEEGHSKGLQRVVEIFDELYDLASKFAALEKN